MAEKLEDYVLNSIELPVLPVVADKILEVASNPKSSANSLGMVISRDEALASRMLKIANSAFYGVSRQISTISEAVTIIGFDGIKNLALALSTRGIYKSFGLPEQLLWDHSLGVAIAARLIASKSTIKQREEAFLSGLIHDIGKIVLLNHGGERYTKVIQRVYNDDLSFSEAEEEVFGFSHAIVGSLVIKKWNFPDYLVSVVRYHNDPKSYKGGEPYIGHMIALVNLADLICNKIGIGRRAPQEGVDIMKSESAMALRSNKEQVTELLEDVPRIFEKEKAWLGG